MFLVFSDGFDNKKHIVTTCHRERVIEMTSHEPTDTSSVGPALLTQAFSVLANTRRRLAVRYLDRHESLSLPTLADGVAEREADAPLQEVDEYEVRDVYLSLYHTHVPTLEDAGVVAYEQEHDWVRCRDTRQREVVTSLLDSVPPTPGNGG